MLRTLHPLKFLDIKFWFLIFNFWPEKLSGLSRYEPQQLYKTGAPNEDIVQNHLT